MKHATSKLIFVALPLLVVGFGWGLAALFELRFAAGDMYPPYSTLRADPLGSKALFDGLAGVRGTDTRRFFGLPDHIGEGRDTTLLLLGLSLRAVQRVNPNEMKELETFLHGGGRIVLAFEPVVADPGRFLRELRDLDEDEAFEKSAKGKLAKSEPSPPESKAETKNSKADESATAPPAEQAGKDKASDTGKSAKRKRRRPLIGDEERAFRGVSLHEQWGFARQFRDLPVNAEGEVETVRAFRGSGADSTLPNVLAWHTALCFQDLTNQWRVVYARDGAPVVIERPFGKGSILVCADSWPFSNEALRADRQAALLAWALGRNRILLFDETHHGIESHPGVMAMLLRFRLHGFLAALLLLALLYIWKNAVPFMPPLAEDQAGGAGQVRGRDSAAGFVNLLRRGIPRMELVHTCFAEWKKTCGRHPRMQKRADEMQGALDSGFAKASGAAHPVDAYRELDRIATKRD